jgi:hypothetical protein
MIQTTITQTDLADFKVELLKEITTLLTKQQHKPSNEMLRSSTVKQMLGCSDSTLEQLRKSNKLPYVNIGGMLFFKKVDVEQLFNQYQ